MTSSDNETPQSVVFVDSQITDYQAIVAAIDPGVKVIVYDGTQDGLAQIAQDLQGVYDLASVDIISHGAADEVQVGTDMLTTSTIPELCRRPGGDRERAGAERPARSLWLRRGGRRRRLPDRAPASDRPQCRGFDRSHRRHCSRRNLDAGCHDRPDTRCAARQFRRVAILRRVVADDAGADLFRYLERSTAAASSAKAIWSSR